MDSTPIEKKTPGPTPLTQPTEFSKRKRKEHVPEDPEPYPSLSDSSSSKYDFLMTENAANLEEITNLIRPMTANTENPKARNATRKKRQKHKKHDLSD